VLAATGCSTDDRPTGGAATSIAPVDHKYGSTPAQIKPQRVVSLGYTDHEPLLALGVRPVGVVDRYAVEIKGHDVRRAVGPSEASGSSRTRLTA
jgi:ABC-type Fe3+-citrate transport system substrate-binding protein